MINNTTGHSNVSIGNKTLISCIARNNNTAIGYESGENYNGNNSTIIGSGAGNGWDLGQSNVLIGHDSGNKVGGSITDSSDNVIIGAGSCVSVGVSDGVNTVIGANSAASLSTGDNNAILGGNSAQTLTTGSNNLILGSQIGVLNTIDSNNILIGDGVETITDSNTLNIGDTVFSNLANRHVRIGGSGTVDGNAALEVSSTTGAFLPPVLTTSQRNALTPKDGYFIFNSTTETHQGFANTAWVDYEDYTESVIRATCNTGVALVRDTYTKLALDATTVETDVKHFTFDNASNNIDILADGIYKVTVCLGVLAASQGGSSHDSVVRFKARNITQSNDLTFNDSFLRTSTNRDVPITSEVSEFFTFATNDVIEIYAMYESGQSLTISTNTQAALQLQYIDEA